MKVKFSPTKRTAENLPKTDKKEAVSVTFDTASIIFL